VRKTLYRAGDCLVDCSPLPEHLIEALKHFLLPQALLFFPFCAETISEYSAAIREEKR